MLIFCRMATNVLPGGLVGLRALLGADNTCPTCGLRLCPGDCPVGSGVRSQLKLGQKTVQAGHVPCQSAAQGSWCWAKSNCAHQGLFLSCLAARNVQQTAHLSGTLAAGWSLLFTSKGFLEVGGDT